MLQSTCGMVPSLRAGRLTVLDVTQKYIRRSPKVKDYEPRTRRLRLLWGGHRLLAFPTLAGPLFLLSFAPTEAVMLTALCSLTGQMVSFLSLRRTVPYVLRLRLIAGCMFGVPIGTTILLATNRHVIGVTIGILLVLTTAWMLVKPRVLVRAAHPSDRAGPFNAQYMTRMARIALMPPKAMRCRPSETL